MKTAKSQVGRPRGWVRAPIVQTGTIRAMMRGCGVALLGSSPLDLRLCRPHHMYICNVSVSSHAAARRSGVGATPPNLTFSLMFPESEPIPGTAFCPETLRELTETLHIYI